MPPTDNQKQGDDAGMEVATEEQFNADAEELVEILFEKWESERKEGKSEVE